MTFSATGIVQSVTARTNGEDGLVLSGPLEGADDGPIVAGSFTLVVRQNAGLQIPVEGDRVSLSGWFSYDDGSRAEVGGDLPTSASGS